MTYRLNTRKPDFDTRFQALVNARRGADNDVHDTVREIIADVRARGDTAVVEYTNRFDKAELTPETLRLPPEKIASIAAGCPADVRAALETACERIAFFHRKQLPQDMETQDDIGVCMGVRWTPMDSVGLYIPGGRATYPSTLCMNAIPAKVAGVGRIAMIVPTPGGEVSPALMAAAQICGIDEIYRTGGAQGIAALAYGTETIAPVDKICGPGNAYVAEAQRQVFGRVGIGLIAGPSEILVVADNQNDPAIVAMDLLSQAEHDESAQSILITDDTDFADSVALAVDKHLETLPRRNIAETSWRENGALIVVEDMFAQAPALVDALAAEHVSIQLDNDEAQEFFSLFRHAGSVFLGRQTVEAIGDYVGGPNHTLPTDRRARYASGVKTTDFMKNSTWLQVGKEHLAQIGPSAVTLAKAEGLDAHALSVSMRLDTL